MIRLTDLCYCYGNHPVLDHLTLSLAPGERAAVLSPSGSGKTTLLRLLAGLERPQSGTIAGLPAEGASMVFQEDRLLPQLSVWDNLALVAEGFPIQRMQALLEEAGLGDWAQRLPGELSGGMARRVAILRALVCRRPFLLLDEPLKGLDEETRERVIQLMDREMAGRTVVLITHNRRDAQQLGCTIYTLEELQRPVPR